MLILTRRVTEAVKICDDITITVLGSKGNQVRLGIDAPKNVPVHREEIYDRIKEEKRRAKCYCSASVKPPCAYCDGTASLDD